MAKGYILQKLFNILPYSYIYYFLKVNRKLWKNKRLIGITKPLILADSRRWCHAIDWFIQFGGKEKNQLSWSSVFKWQCRHCFCNLVTSWLIQYSLLVQAF